MAQKPVRKAHLVAITAPTGNGYRWRWQALDGTEASSRSFDLFYECLTDAQRSGYEVELGPPPAALDSAYLRTAPAGRAQACAAVMSISCS